MLFSSRARVRVRVSLLGLVLVSGWLAVMPELDVGQFFSRPNRIQSIKIAGELVNRVPLTIVMLIFNCGKTGIVKNA